MKKIIMVLIGIILLIGSVTVVTAEDSANSKGNVRLPADYVIMNARYGPNSWFDMKLSEVPDGFLITNGNYLGWCIQQSIYMTQKVNHTVMLYSSYDSEMPDNYKNDNWDKVNYIINHKTGGRSSVQEAIWYFIENKAYPTDVDAQKMIDDADLNGDGFIPGPGQVIAIVVEGIPSIQRTFLELNLPESVQIGDLVWFDINENGIQEKGEPGASDVEVILYDEENLIVDTTKTDIGGYYSFYGVSLGKYYLKFVAPEGYKFTKEYRGSNSYLDSDANVNTGKTVLFTVKSAEYDISRDAGLVEKTGTGVPNPGVVILRPTADATAGEPYSAVENKKIEFNGSRSYDRDGYIVSWKWDFGDGNTKSGEIVKHIYRAQGTYVVKLTVTDNDGLNDTYETEANIKFANRAPENLKINGPVFGHKNIFYSYSVVSNDPDEDKVKYSISWGDEDPSKVFSEFITSGVPFMAANSWNEPGKYTVKATASDSILSSSNKLVVYIDRVDVDDIGYIIDENSDGIFDTFYYTYDGSSTKIKHVGLNRYLIDVDGDGDWDYEFDSETGELFDYDSGIVDYNFLLIILALLAILFLIIIFIYRKKKNNY